MRVIKRGSRMILEKREGGGPYATLVKDRSFSCGWKGNIEIIRKKRTSEGKRCTIPRKEEKTARAQKRSE